MNSWLIHLGAIEVPHSWYRCRKSPEPIQPEEKKVQIVPSESEMKQMVESIDDCLRDGMFDDEEIYQAITRRGTLPSRFGVFFNFDSAQRTMRLRKKVLNKLNKHVKEERNKRIIEAYLDGESKADLGKRYGISEPAINVILREKTRETKSDAIDRYLEIVDLYNPPAMTRQAIADRLGFALEKVNSVLKRCKVNFEKIESKLGEVE